MPWYSSEESQLIAGCVSSRVTFGRVVNSVLLMSRPESTIEIGTPGAGRLDLVGADAVELPAEIRRRERVAGVRCAAGMTRFGST